MPEKSSKPESPTTPPLPRGVMLNAYPDSIGERLCDTIALLRRPELAGTFSLFYVLPTFFNSDLDRGFSVIDYGLNRELVEPSDLEALEALGITLKLDLVLNHLSMSSPQFRDLLEHGDASPYRDFFIDWNAFWDGEGTLDDDGNMRPAEHHLEKLFLRKPGLPILRVCFPDGSQRTYWNTFYQKISFCPLEPEDLSDIDGLHPQHAASVVDTINEALAENACIESMDLGDHASPHREHILRKLSQKREFLGQMDLNARSELVWDFYDDTLRQLADYGAKIIRLDAFAYLHKEPGQPNFFNRPGTWEYLERLHEIAKRYELVVFPEIHAEYGVGIHEEIADEGYPIYDFFLPGLLIDALDRADGAGLVRWIDDIQRKGLHTINMLGCHDGLPILDLRGKQVDGRPYRAGLLADDVIDAMMDRVMERGGRVKNLYGSDGRKIAYYQVNATFFSAIGEDHDKMRLARALQLFMPGVPQVWYLDLFAGRNDYEAADAGGTAGHKEINRTNLALDDIDKRLEWPIVQDQLALIRLRNQSRAFEGQLTVESPEPHRLQLVWTHEASTLRLDADLEALCFEISEETGAGEAVSLMAFGPARDVPSVG